MSKWHENDRWDGLSIIWEENPFWNSSKCRRGSISALFRKYLDCWIRSTGFPLHFLSMVLNYLLFTKTTGVGLLQIATMLLLRRWGRFLGVFTAVLAVMTRIAYSLQGQDEDDGQCETGDGRHQSLLQLHVLIFACKSRNCRLASADEDDESNVIPATAVCSSAAWFG